MTGGAYYNEFDPGAVAWLRELIKAGLIADGEVDERSILDVRADDLRGFTQCHFFAGIGGWSYALRIAGWPDDRPVWTGSPPCQPFSVSGKNEGKNDDRHLAPYFIDLVGASRPGLLFGEQVASAAVFGKAAKRPAGNAVAPPEWAWIDDLSDRLEAARYAVGAVDFPSAGVGAPHIRQRTFFGAISHEWLAHGERDGQHGCGNGRARRRDEPANVGAISRLVNDQCAGLEGHGRHGDGSHESGRIDPDATGSVAATGTDGRLAQPYGAQTGRKQGDSQPAAGGEFHDPRPLHGFWGDADWLFCRDGKWRPVEPGTFPLAHGVSGRVGLLRGYGNAINPWAAAEFIRSFETSLRHFRMTDLSEISADNMGIFG